ncbi:CoA-disulfide reductase [Lacticigenium naphthae]|uniref:CoA-disulfide reductase n=1 Tax=Lacticigenium naphthae TaxID=515351 RepID=UPI000403AA95|nr:CoA-disulfide reductase [Lacticigenium naphthae]
MSRKIIIVGGVAGGATAAARLRRLNEQDEIILLEKGEYISFANCGLPYHIGGTIKERDSLLLETVDGMSKKFNLDVRNFNEVISIDKDEKSVMIKNHQTGNTYKETFDKLVLSTGARPIAPPIKGVNEANNIFTLRNIPDMDAIKEYVENNQVKKVAVIGGGFIGLEMMENLHELGLDVSVIEMTDQVMAPVDFEMAQLIHSHIELYGVNLVLNDGVDSFEKNGKEIRLCSGKTVASDMTILSIGVTPESELAKQAGLEIGLRGSIVVNKQLQTSAEDIYAIGDVIEVKDFINGQATLVPLAWPANRQGRILADHFNGEDISYEGTLGTSVAKVFQLTVASSGNNEKTLKRLGLDYEVVHIHPNSHAGYYPGASPLDIKLLFSPEGKIYGVQAIGMDGVEKRVDVIATAMKLHATIFDLPTLELAYAPPYSSAKDPVNIAGYAAGNLLKGTVHSFQWHEVDQLIADGALFLDVREEFEQATGTLAGSVNIPLDQIRERMNELPKDKTVYVYCQVGHRGYNAARILMQNGFDVKNLDGGYKTYKTAYVEIKPKEAEKEVAEVNLNHQPNSEINTQAKQNVITVDACGLQCPGPILKVKETIDAMETGQEMYIEASDFGFLKDIEAWTKNTNNTLISSEIDGKIVKAHLAKGRVSAENTPGNTAETAPAPIQAKDGATMVVFDGDFDKAIASFIIANGAAAYGKEVTMFFTFWGLNILKKENGPKLKKTGFAKMFDKFLPSNVNELPISQMNMGGMGTKMIQKVMKQHNVDSLPQMIAQAQKMGVKMVACTMSMDLMGIQEEELIDGVEFGGVAAYIGDTTNSNMNLFI